MLSRKSQLRGVRDEEMKHWGIVAFRRWLNTVSVAVEAAKIFEDAKFLAHALELVFTLCDKDPGGESDLRSYIAWHGLESNEWSLDEKTKFLESKYWKQRYEELLNGDRWDWKI